MCCSVDILHHSESGYVGRCSYCDHFQIAFGTIMITFSKCQTESFLRGINSQLEKRKGICPIKKSFFFQTNSREVQLVLNYSELEELSGMIERALWMNDVLKIILEGE